METRAGDEQLRWKLLGCHSLLDNRYVKLHANDYQLPDGTEVYGFYVVKEMDGANVVAVTSDLKIVLVRQYRPGIDEVIYEFPGGLVEVSDGSPLERARAELREETGYATEEWQLTGVTRPAPHRLSTRQHCFLATNIERVGSQTLEQLEFIGVELVSISKLLKMIGEGVFSCGACIASLFHAMQADPRLRGW